MVDRRIKFWVAKRLEWEISDSFQLDFTYSNLSFFRRRTALSTLTLDWDINRTA